MQDRAKMFTKGRTIALFSGLCVWACGTESSTSIAPNQDVEVATHTLLEGIDPDRARDYVDGKGKKWNFVRIVEQEDFATGSIEEEESKPVNTTPPSLEAYLGGKARRLTFDGRHYYEYESAETNDKLRARIDYFQSQAELGVKRPRQETNEPEVHPTLDELKGHQIVGGEDRTEVSNPGPYWYSAIAASFRNDNARTCTAVMVGPQTAVTAAHCHWTYVSGAGSWVPMSYFLFGYDGDDGSYTYNGNSWSVTVHTSYVAGGSTFYDLAVIEFNTDFGEDDTGYFGVDMVPPTTTENYYVHGYPGLVNKPGFSANELWGAAITNTKFGYTDNLVYHDFNYPTWYSYHKVDSSGGESGSVLYWLDNNEPYAVMGNQAGYDNDCPNKDGTAGTGDCNGAPRLGSVWVPFIEDNSSYLAFAWGSYPHAP